MNRVKMKIQAMTSRRVVRYKLHSLIRNLPIEAYHGNAGSWSSSQFKDALDDMDLFIKKYIQKVIARESNAAFDIGTYFHTGVLEPHKLKFDCIVYPGKVRRGKDWDKFKVKHQSKAIVTQSQKDQAEGLVRCVKASPIAQGYLVGTPEVSLFTEIAILSGNIYAPYFNVVLTRDGWQHLDYAMSFKKAFKMIVKVRADMLGDTFISDLKSTTGNARSNKSMREKISHYQYDLSASLYLDMFSLVKPELQEFAWIFASKDFFNSRTYTASETNIRVGRAKYMKAMLRMADYAAGGWQSVDYLDQLEPLPYELEHLKERDTDLL